MTADQDQESLDRELRDRIRGLDLTVLTDGVRARVEQRQRSIVIRRRTAIGVLAGVTAAVTVVGALLISRHASSQSVTTGPVPVKTAGLLPPARGGGVMAFDPATGQLILFGGTGAFGSLGDTWTWNGQSWTQLHPLHSPPAQSDSLMGYDPATRRLVLIGAQALVADTDPCTRLAGQTPSCEPVSLFRGVPLSLDTWTWDGSDWTDLAIAPMPADSQLQETSPGQNQVVTDPGTNSLLLVDDGSPKLWSWTGRGWQTIHSVHTPPVGSMAAGADASTGDLLAVVQPVSGPPREPELPIETWDWNGHDWTELHPKTEPSGFDVVTSERGTVTVISGTTQWLWKSGDWQKQTVQTPRIPRQAQVADDPATKQFMVFAGYGGSAMNIEENGRWSRVVGPAAPTPAPAPPGQYTCFTNSDVFATATRQPDGSVSIKISAIVAGPPPCQFDFHLGLTLADQSGHSLAVSGNPLTATDVQSIAASNSGTATLSGGYNWANWCAAAPAGLQLIVVASGPGYNKTQPPESPLAISAPPSCRSSGSPSTLTTTAALRSTPDP